MPISDYRIDQDFPNQGLQGFWWVYYDSELILSYREINTPKLWNQLSGYLVMFYMETRFLISLKNIVIINFASGVLPISESCMRLLASWKVWKSILPDVLITTLLVAHPKPFLLELLDNLKR